MWRRAFGQMDYLMKDLARLKCASIKDVFYAFFEQAVWATVIYRVTRLMFLIDIPILRFFLRLIGFFMMKSSEVFLGAVIKPEADIGPGLFISHTGVIRIHPKTKAGKNLSLTAGTILGEKGLGGKGAPTLGDNVFLGAGVKVLGNVKIGSNAKIGANAVVVKDIPEGATAVGVPAKVISVKKSSEAGHDQD